MSGVALLALIQRFRYLTIVPLAALEGPLVMILTGYLVAHGEFDFFPAYLLLIVGDLVGDLVYYALGRAAHHPQIVRWRNWFGLSNKRISEIVERFGTVTGKTLLLGKTLHGLGTAVLISAGVTQMPLKEFIVYNLIGTIPKSLVFMLLGFFFGAAFETINHYLRLGAEVGIVALVIAIIIGVILLQFPKLRTKKRQ